MGQLHEHRVTEHSYVKLRCFSLISYTTQLYKFILVLISYANSNIAIQYRCMANKSQRMYQLLPSLGLLELSAGQDAKTFWQRMWWSTSDGEFPYLCVFLVFQRQNVILYLFSESFTVIVIYIDPSPMNICMCIYVYVYVGCGGVYIKPVEVGPCKFGRR